ncbi:MAG: hypothetical protein ACRC6U_09275 [Fusobacteriaceae bacterium]
MGLFFGNNDVKVLIEKAAKLSLGKLDKMLIVTDEADIPATALSGSDAKTELTAILGANSAPKLMEALTVALGQEDNSGNKLTTSYIFVLGKKILDADKTPIYEAIETFDKTREADFYGIAATFEDASFEEWAQTYTPNHLFATSTISDRVLGDLSKSGRIFGQSMKEAGYNHIAWMARGLFANRFIGWKFKKLNGCTTDPLTDGATEMLHKAGWNGYRSVRGKGQTTASLCTDGSTHIDETLLRDTIVYNVANLLMDMFDNEEVVPMGYNGKKLITAYINSALNYCGSLGLIEVGEDGGYLFEVTVPEFTKEMKSLRELASSEPLFRYSPNIPLEKVTVIGKEVLEWTGGNL